MPCAYTDTKKTKFSRKEINAFMMPMAEPKATIEMTDRVLKILDSNVEKSNLD